MSLDHYQFQMIYRQEHMTHAERIAADERAGRIAQGLFGQGQAIARAVGRRDTERLGGAAMRLRRTV